MIHLVESPVLYVLAKKVENKRWGLLKRLHLLRAIETLAAVALLDHALSAARTASSHSAALAISRRHRAAQILLIGVDPRSLIFWQTFLLLSILFHHSNLRLRKPIEDRLVRVIVTPRMHGIHHSEQPENQNSNWSGGFTIWDSLHRTSEFRGATGKN